MVVRLALIAVVVALAACASSAADSGVSPNCAPGTARTIDASHVAGVYVVGKTVYGCSDQTGKRWRLGQTASCIGSALVQAVAVEGALAGYGLMSCGVDTGDAVVIVRRMTDGKQLVDRPATNGSAGVESYSSVDTLVLKRDRAVAWIGIDQSLISYRRRVEVRAVQHGHESLLDSGLRVLPDSLRLHGSTLSWRHGQSIRHATLS